MAEHTFTIHGCTITQTHRTDLKPIIDPVTKRLIETETLGDGYHSMVTSGSGESTVTYGPYLFTSEAIQAAKSISRKQTPLPPTEPEVTPENTELKE